MSTLRRRIITGLALVAAVAVIIVLSQVVPTAWRSYQLVRASDEVLGKIERMYLSYGFAKTDQYCEEMGLFEWGEYRFRCSVNTGSWHAPSRYSTIRKASVLVYHNERPTAGGMTGAIHFQERLLLSVPYLPSTSTVWENDWTARPGI